MSSASIARETIGPYRVINFIGAGGMGAVYRAVHMTSGQVVAIKVLKESTVGSSGLARFRNEARIHQTLSHPNIARMYDYMEYDGLSCLVMEYVDGESLDERIGRTGPLSVVEALGILCPLAEGVEYIHSKGVIHRDLKTGNVRIRPDGTVKILDFGIAKTDDGPRLTSTGNVVGTLLCLAPEQLTTGKAEERTDIWALGIVMYEMLTGKSPFSSGVHSAGAMQGVFPGERILKGAFPLPSAIVGGITRDVDRMISKCLKVRPQERYASVSALLREARSIQEHLVGKQQVRNHTSGSGVAASPSMLLRQSGDVVREIARRWRLFLSGSMAVAALVAFVAAIARSPENQRTGKSANVVTGAADSLGASAVTAGHAVVVRVLEGPAMVFRDGRQVGTTPYTLIEQIGAEVELILRRSGCEDTPVRLRMAEGLDAIMESMRGCRELPGRQN